MSKHLAVGARVRLIGMPDELFSLDDLLTVSLFRACLGRTVSVRAIYGRVVELDVSEVLGVSAAKQLIFVDCQYVEVL